MKTETIEALRALARQLGLRGYSSLRKDELIKLIASQKRKSGAKSATKPRITAARAVTQRKKPRRTPGKPAGTTPALSPSVAGVTSAPQTAAETEQRIESAKYTLAPPGTREPAYAADLGEDIDRLPVIREPRLCLLPQKPGVLHGYWTLPAAWLDAERSVRLRLATYAGDRLAILAEHPVPSEFGHWYFHVEEGIALGAVCLQLGRYRPDGGFASILQHNVARIPSLYASTLTDRRWWVDEAQFRDMYRRAGGLEHGRRLGWAGSASSPGRALAWPGNISSQR